MARILSREFDDWNDRRYRVEINLDEEGFDPLQSQYVIEVDATVHDPATGINDTVGGTVTIDVERNLVIVKIGELEREFPLVDRYDPRLAEDDGDVRDESDVPDGLPGFMEEAIQSLPIPVDPLLGCVLKSGISATVGQVIRCNNEYVLLKKDHTMRERLTLMFECLRENSGKIMRRAFFRTLKCWVTLGWR